MQCKRPLGAVYRDQCDGQQVHACTFWSLGLCVDSSVSLTAALKCCLQVNMLRRRDAEQGRIAFVDISAPDYSAANNADISYEQVDTRGCEV